MTIDGTCRSGGVYGEFYYQKIGRSYNGMPFVYTGVCADTNGIEGCSTSSGDPSIIALNGGIRTIGYCAIASGALCCPGVEFGGCVVSGAALPPPTPPSLPLLFRFHQFDHVGFDD